MVCQVLDDQGQYYCLKKDIDFFIYYQYSNLSGKVIRELSIEELEKEFNQTSCFVLSKEQFKCIENDDIYCNCRKTRNGFIPIVSVMVGMICVIFYIIRIFK